MAKKLYSDDVNRIRIEYSKISSEIRKQVKDLKAENKNARILGQLTITDFAGLRARKKMKLSNSPKHLEDLTRTLKKLRKSKVLDIRAEDRAERAAAQTLKGMGYGDIEAGDVKELFAFLDKVAAAGLDSLFNSNYWIKAFERAKRRGLTMDDLVKSVERMEQKVTAGREIKRAYLKKY